MNILLLLSASSMEEARTRGMHLISDHDDMMDHQLFEGEEEQIEEIYDDDNTMHMVFGGEDIRKKEERETHQSDDDDEQPPTLEPEEAGGEQVLLMQQEVHRKLMESYENQGFMSPGGTTYLPDDTYVDNMYQDGMMQMMETGEASGSSDPKQSRLQQETIEFSFLDNKNVCCGLCGDIVLYEELLSEHIPTAHPEVFGSSLAFEEVGYEDWLKDKIYTEKKANNLVFSMHDEMQQQLVSRVGRACKRLRTVSQIRVNTASMSLAELEVALRRKMVEKMGRRVNVSLVDKLHARCGICNAVVSLNKKFEIIHLVRHFNAWHPAAHRCSGTWPDRAILHGPGQPLSSQDFAVVSLLLEAPESLQCIWCGMFMDRTMLAMHFHEVHQDDVEVPKCNLCVQEVVINARLHEKHKQDFDVRLPNEHHIKCDKLGGMTFSTEKALDTCIERRLKKMQDLENGEHSEFEVDDVEEEMEETAEPDQQKMVKYSNSRMALGRRHKLKRNFTMPCLRQAIPQDSKFVEPLSEGQWSCKLCGDHILAAVISAGAIKHFQEKHPEDREELQYELCKARLERVSDGCMEFKSPLVIECLICNSTYTLHREYNMCRGIRHLKQKHPEMMPEYSTTDEPRTEQMPRKKRMRRAREPDYRKAKIGECVDDPEVINKFKQQYDVAFDAVQSIITAEGERIYVLMADGQKIDDQMVERIQDASGKLLEGEKGRPEEHEDELFEIVEEMGEEMSMPRDSYQGAAAPVATAAGNTQHEARKQQMPVNESLDEEDTFGYQEEGDFYYEMEEEEPVVVKHEMGDP